MLPTKFRSIWPSCVRVEFFLEIDQSEKKNCLWRPCLLTDWDEMSNLYSGPSIDAFYKVSVHMAKGFQRRRLKCEKLTDHRRQTTDNRRQTTDNGRQVMAKAYIAFGKVS